MTDAMDQVRERLALHFFRRGNLVGLFKWEELSEASRVQYYDHADAVLDLLGLEQVGWQLGRGLHEYVPIEDVPGDHHQNSLVPVYRLSEAGQ